MARRAARARRAAGRSRARGVRRSAAVGSVVLAGALALGGCGVSAQSLHPGAAADVDGATISLSSVDDATKAYCALVAAKAPEPLSGAAARQAVLQGLALRELAERIVARGHYDVTPSADYDQQVAMAQATLADLSAGQRRTLLPAYLGGAYFADVMAQIGRQRLGLSADQDTQGAGLSAGLKVAQAFLRDHPITVDPVFESIGVGDIDVGVISRRVDTSVPVSEFAQAAAAAQDDPTPTGAATAYVDSLPAAQRCG